MLDHDPTRRAIMYADERIKSVDVGDWESVLRAISEAFRIGYYAARDDLDRPRVGLGGVAEARRKGTVGE